MNINLSLFGQMITFILFVWFTKQFVWPPMIQALRERQAKIADGLAAAERGHLELENAQKQVTLELKKSKDDAANIILQAQKQADEVIEKARHQAREEGQKIIEQAHAEVQHMIGEAKEGLRQQVSAIVLVGVEKVLQQSVDEKVHSSMLENLTESI